MTIYDTYQKYVQSTQPLIYVDWTKPFVNMGTGGDGSHNTSYNNTQTVAGPNNVGHDGVGRTGGAIASFVTQNMRSVTWSWAAWVRVSDSGNYNLVRIYANDDAFTYNNVRVLIRLSGNQLQYQYADISGNMGTLTNAGATVPNNEWVHVAIVREAPTQTHRFRVYKNGVLVNTISPVTSSMGASNTALTQRVALTMPVTPSYSAEAAVWSRSLTPDEVANLYSFVPTRPFSIMEGGGSTALVLDGIYETRGTNTAIWPVDIEGELVYPPRRYYDVEPILAAADAATNKTQLAAAANPMEPTYGGTNLSWYTSTTTVNGWTCDSPNFDDPGFVESFKTHIDQTAKYPPAFFASLAIPQIMVAKNCRYTDGPHDGVSFYANAAGVWVKPYQSPQWLFREVEFSFHHEVAHQIWYKWRNAEFAAMKTKWTALTPYVGEDWNQNPDQHPPGFLRRYSSKEFEEDVADFMGAVMATNVQEFVAEKVATDPIAAEKISDIKAFFASKSTEMAHPLYYHGIHKEAQ
jgi:hypothetical protein